MLTQYSGKPGNSHGEGRGMPYRSEAAIFKTSY
jgi:hypothetical protein